MATFSVYAIENTSNGRVYVGQSCRFEIRRRQHLTALRGGRHHSPFLQHDWTSCGEKAFDIYVLDDGLDSVEATVVEKKLIRWFKDISSSYNMTDGGEGHLGYRASSETRQRMSATMKGKNTWMLGRKLSDETRTKMSIASSSRPSGMLGHKHTPEVRAAMSHRMRGDNNPFYGKHHSDETKARLSAGRKGKCCGAEHPMYGKHHTEETRAKLREARKRRSPVVHTEESKQKMSDSQKRAWRRRRGIE